MPAAQNAPRRTEASPLKYRSETHGASAWKSPEGADSRHLRSGFYIRLTRFLLFLSYGQFRSIRALYAGYRLQNSPGFDWDSRRSGLGPKAIASVKSRAKGLQ